MDQQQKRGRGRPKGSTNKSKDDNVTDHADQESNLFLQPSSNI